MSTVNLTIDNKNISTNKEATILQAAKENGINIPTLCMLDNVEAKANCRICLVEVQGARTFIPSCATKVSDGMVVKTNTDAVRKSRKTTLELILARHPVDCHHCLRIGNSFCADLDPYFCEMCFFCDCEKEGFCELQALAREYEVDLLPFDVETKGYEIDYSTGAILKNPNKCINCRRCIDACSKIQNVGALATMNRGSKTIVGISSSSLEEDATCVQCGRCVDACPTASIFMKERIDEVIYYAHRYEKTTVALVSSNILERLAFLCEIDIKKIDLLTVVAGLRKIGFDHVILEDDIINQTQKIAENMILDKISSNEVLLLTRSYATKEFIRRRYPNFNSKIIAYPSVQEQFSKIIYGEFAKNHNLKESDIYSVFVTEDHESASEVVHDGGVNHVMGANELYRIFIRTGVNIKRIVPTEFDKLEIENNVISNEVNQLLSQTPKEMSQIEYTLNIGSNKNIKGVKCSNLRQVGLFLDSTENRHDEVVVASLFS